MRKYFSEHEPKRTVLARHVWGAVPSKPSSRPPLEYPVKYVMMMDTASEGCRTKEECIAIIKRLQTKFMEELGFEDIPWSFLVGGDGNAYEGRGWDVSPLKTDLKVKKQRRYDGRSIDVAYIGDYSKKFPSSKMQHGFCRVMVEGIDKDKLPLIFHIRRFVKKAKIEGRYHVV